MTFKDSETDVIASSKESIGSGIFQNFFSMQHFTMQIAQSGW
ncbi:hypothetical protein QQ008_29370 [Fulvivirgaceae bacterium BMA10]|uniref:Uncharacterized protein n=1 Tax=Splendidivirga corallicola TaxID=3051826 RepID=A0ABT8L1P4_9BACT|nr:hypothetical protein [Fulvivirgaceae bacterium BMA10]